jgi:hypothetical protein
MGDPDASFTMSGSVEECFFIMMKRTLMKDELKKGVFAASLTGALGVASGTDTAANTSYEQTVGGDYAYVYSDLDGSIIGQVWYNAGIIVMSVSSSGLPWQVSQIDTTPWSGSLTLAQYNLWNLMSSGTIDNLITGLRAHISNLALQNQTNLYSTIYFCRATNTEFNYSSNPTYVDSSQRIIVTSGSNVMQPRTYITKIGLYDANDNLLAAASVSDPITKGPDTESIFRVRLDY